MKLRLLTDVYLGTAHRRASSFISVSEEVGNYLLSAGSAVLFEEDAIPVSPAQDPTAPVSNSEQPPHMGKKGNYHGSKRAVPDTSGVTVAFDESKSE